MRVIISPKERYELEMPAEVSIEDFRVLVKKLNVVMSFCDGKDISAKQISQSKKPHLGPVARPREEYCEILKILFTLSPGPEMDEALNKYGLKYALCNNYKWKWVEKYQIKPEELGMEKFPDKQAGRPKSV